MHVYIVCAVVHAWWHEFRPPQRFPAQIAWHSEANFQVREAAAACHQHCAHYQAYIGLLSIVSHLLAFTCPCYFCKALFLWKFCASSLRLNSFWVAQGEVQYPFTSPPVCLLRGHPDIFRMHKERQCHCPKPRDRHIILFLPLVPSGQIDLINPGPEIVITGTAQFVPYWWHAPKLCKARNGNFILPFDIYFTHTLVSERNFQTTRSGSFPGRISEPPNQSFSVRFP